MSNLRQWTIILPPILLTIIGFGTYLAIQHLTAPKVTVLRALTPSPSPSSSSASSSPTPNSTIAPLTSPIQTHVATPSATTVTALQQRADQKQDLWRLDPLQTAKQESLQYGFAVDDSFSATQTGTPTGTATVLAQHGSAHYLLTLSQPGIQGSQGVWVLQAITQQ